MGSLIIALALALGLAAPVQASQEPGGQGTPAVMQEADDEDGLDDTNAAPEDDADGLTDDDGLTEDDDGSPFGTTEDDDDGLADDDGLGTTEDDDSSPFGTTEDDDDLGAAEAAGDDDDAAGVAGSPAPAETGNAGLVASDGASNNYTGLALLALGAAGLATAGGMAVRRRS